MAIAHQNQMSDLKTLEDHLRYLLNRIKRQYQDAQSAVTELRVESDATKNWNEIRTGIKKWNVLFCATSWVKCQMSYYEGKLEESTAVVGDVKKFLQSNKRHLNNFENEKEQIEKRFKVRDNAYEERIKKVEIKIAKKKIDLGILFSSNKEAYDLIVARKQLGQEKDKLAVSNAKDIVHLEKSIKECESERTKLKAEHDRPDTINKELKVVGDLLRSVAETSEATLTVEEAILEKRFGWMKSTDASEPFMLTDFTEIMALQFLCQHVKQIIDMTMKVGTNDEALRDRINDVISMHQMDFTLKQGEICVVMARSGVIRCVSKPAADASA